MHMPTAHPDGSFPGGSPERAGGYNKPRRLSNSSSTSSVTTSSVGHDSVDSRVRTSSFTSSQTSFDSYSPRTSSAPVTWQNGAGGQSYPWHRPAPIKQRKKAQPGEQFAALPGEILELILAELRKLHLRPGSNSCATCWMRDCCSVAISARKFLKYAREALYQHIQLVGHESPAMKKRTKTAYGSRLVLLRRTLRANAQIAAAVRSLKPPARPMSVGLIAYNDLVASVVMACPNLERLVGYHPTYDHSFQRLFQALSTRPKLKEMNWILEPSAKQQQQRMRPQEARWGPGDLEPQESQLFMGFHADWRQLTTLVVHCQPGAALSPPSLLGGTIRALPALQNLYLSHMPPTAFNDRNLLALPALRKLSLSSCTGVTTAGLSALATRRTSTSLSALTLLQMNVESLPAIARILSYLVRLETFTIVQTYAPEMPPDEFMILFPYLASQSLRKLHWDIPYLPNTSTPADTILARSISAGGFPSLRALCTPNDPDGLFQSLCAPRERVDHPTDRYRGLFPVPGQTGQNTTPWGHTRNSSSFSSTNSGGAAATPTGNGSSGLSFGRSTPTSMNPFRSRSRTNSRPNTPNGTGNGGANTPTPQSPLFPPLDALIPRENSNLAQARLAAQARLEAAQRIPRYLVHVFDEDQGAMVEKFGIGAFLGHVESRIRYVLSPDVASGATDEGGGVVSVEDMMRDDGGEMVGFFGGFLGGSGSRRGSSAGGAGDETNGDTPDTRGEGCTGRWNTYSGMVVDKKDQERWWHQERGRWRGVVLS
ncbi:uncharacterized protein C8A04DRAFT_40228 [Dichotomopilus funicola]|uniref:Uncharacterized protein n=1 Tax=Dichotomopilus funicola TaxID=1934379 RepID=A0AAN6UVK9_9PEZI|nr:hypothetical protein C8A04DRAFT_40228 [Dichotomopilus funicola]